MEWTCSKCKTKNTNTNICTKCGFDESRNYARYATITILKEKDKTDFRKMVFKGDNVLMACPDTNLVFGKKMDRSEIKSIEIYNTLSKANESAWDVSAHKDGSVLAWVVEDEDGAKHLKLAAEGDIIANEDCCMLFEKYYALEHIEGIQYLNTENVTSMSMMFFGCNSLQELDLGSFDTKNVTSMSMMFQNCENLKTLNLRNFNTKNVTDMSAMFYECRGLTTLNLNSFDTRNVTDMEFMFLNCINLQSLDLGNFDTKSVANMHGMFSDCESLQSLNLSNFDTRRASRMESLFWDCKGLKILDLSSFNTENIADMKFMFSDCESLQSLDLSSFNTENVVNMTNMFSNCKSLKSLDLRSFDTRNVRDMGMMFFSCENLQELNLDSFDISSVHDMKDMFGSCKNLERLDFKNLDTKKIKYRFMFQGCENLQKVNADCLKEMSANEECEGLQELQNNTDKEPVTDVVSAKGDNILMACQDNKLVFGKEIDRSEIVSINIFNTLSAVDETYKMLGIVNPWDISAHQDGSVLAWVVEDIDGSKNLRLAAEGKIIANENSASLFKNYDKVEYIYGLQYLDTKNVTNMKSMFWGCRSLQELDLSKFDTEHVTDMSTMFFFCKSLQKLNLNNFDTKNVTNMKSMFGGCDGLQEIDLGSFDTRNVTNMNGMFTECNSLRKVDLSKFDLRNVKSPKKLKKSSQIDEKKLFEILKKLNLFG